MYGVNLYDVFSSSGENYEIEPSLYSLKLASLYSSIIGLQVIYQNRRLPVTINSITVEGIQGLQELFPVPMNIIISFFRSSINETYISLQLENAGPGFYIDDLIISNVYDYTSEGALYNIHNLKAIVIKSEMPSNLIDETVDIKVVGGSVPQETNGIEFVRVGNINNKSRQGSILLASMDPSEVDDKGILTKIKTAPFIAVMDGVTSLDATVSGGYMHPSTFRFVAGRLDSFNFPDSFGQLTTDGEEPSEDGSNANYGIYTDNGYFSGKICLGSATSLTTGTGLFADKLGNFRVGDPDVSYMKWEPLGVNGATLRVKGNIHADSGIIGGFNIEGTILWGGDVVN